MLNLSQFKRRLPNTTSVLWLCATIETNNNSKFYVISPEDQYNLSCALMELYQEEIKDIAIDMVTSDELIKAPNEEKYHSRGYYFFFLTLAKYSPPIRPH